MKPKTLKEMRARRPVEVGDPDVGQPGTLTVVSYVDLHSWPAGLVEMVIEDEGDLWISTFDADDESERRDLTWKPAVLKYTRTYEAAPEERRYYVMDARRERSAGLPFAPRTPATTTSNFPMANGNVCTSYRSHTCCSKPAWVTPLKTLENAQMSL